MIPEEAAALFFPGQGYVLRSLGEGNVNQTFLLALDTGEQVVLQRVNPAVFPDPVAIQKNFHLVSTHLHRCLTGWGLSIPVVHPLCPQGQDAYMDTEGGLWRLLSFIDHSRTLAVISTSAQAASLGIMLAWFHRALARLDPVELVDPLPGFHDTRRYLEEMKALLTPGTVLSPREERCFSRIREQEELVEHFTGNAPQLGRQVIHSDPKVANFLFDPAGQSAITLIDLDTVRPGILVHDLADCLRSCCNPAGEDQDDLEKISFHPQLFQGMLQGYWSVAAGLLRPADRDMLVTATGLICLELAIRFFADHLAGNQYFKVTHPGHNLARAETQLALLASIITQQEQLEAIVDELQENSWPA